MKRLLAVVAVCLVALPLAAQAQRHPFVDRADLPAGVGIAQVHPKPDGVLPFYAPPAPGEMPGDRPPIDVVRFSAGVPAVDIAEAPPWLVPDHLKMDYEIFYLRAVTLTRDWLEVIGNSTTGETVWIARADASFVPWPEFLIGVHSVEAFEGRTIEVRARPLDDSPLRRATAGPLTALAARGEWLEVEDGWLRWRRGDRLLLRYNPLS
jgi:hypothetical protein